MLYFCNLKTAKREYSSAGSERLPYKQEVTGSNPVTPTNRKSLHQEAFLIQKKHFITLFKKYFHGHIT